MIKRKGNPIGFFIMLLLFTIFGTAFGQSTGGEGNLLTTFRVPDLKELNPYTSYSIPFEFTDSYKGWIINLYIQKAERVMEYNHYTLGITNDPFRLQVSVNTHQYRTGERLHYYWTVEMRDKRQLKRFNPAWREGMLTITADRYIPSPPLVEGRLMDR